MAKLELTSNITFLYFKDLEKAKHFFSETLGLEVAYDPGWACVYRLKDKAFLGAVDNAQGSIQVDSTSSVLVSLTVANIHEVHAAFEGAEGVDGLSPIKQIKVLAESDEAGVVIAKTVDNKSFFFTGPEGYHFEVEQFTSGELQKLF